MTWSQVKNPYLITLVGVILIAIAEIYGVVRAMMFRAMFRPGGFNGTGTPPGGYGGYGAYAGPRFGGGFGATNWLTILGLIILIIGIVWLGMALRKTSKA